MLPSTRSRACMRGCTRKSESSTLNCVRFKARGKAHRIEVVRHQAATMVEVRQGDLEFLLVEVDRQKRLYCTRKQHMQKL